MKPDQIVTLLKDAADAYYNGKTLTMDDDTYDSLLETLKEADPQNPYLQSIGAPVTKGTTVTLPYPMPSLDKIKPGQDALQRFLKIPDMCFVLTEKLDGLSALWIPSKGRGALYLRGDGITGQDISHLVPLGIQGLHRPFNTCVIRGELVVSRTQVATLARSWVNGVIHQSSPSKEDVQRLRFVAYDLLNPPNLTRYQQFTWLKSQGFEIPWLSVMRSTTEDELAQHLQARRKDSPYDTDGIVVAYDVIPVRPLAAKNPKDAVAFKMPLAEQSAVTTLREIIWTPSAQGYIVPRLRFDPVTIGGAQIEFCTGHNARTVVDKGLTAGVQIRIRRSGDVIPTLDSVLTPCAAADAGLPPVDGSWEWDSTAATAAPTHIRLVAANDTQTVAQLQHFFKVLAVPSMGPANCDALVKGGLTTVKAIWDATPERLATILGPKTGAALHAAIRTALQSPTLKEQTLMVASSKMPRTIGEAKLTSISATHPDPRTWATLSTAPAGWTEQSLRMFQAEFPKYVAWRQSELSWLPYPLGLQEPLKTLESMSTNKCAICFTGFREKDMEAKAVAAGFRIAPALSSKVSILLIPDPPAQAGAEKLKRAQELGTKEILSRSEFISKYLTPS